MVKSKLKGFYRLPMTQRRSRAAEIAKLTEEEIHILSGEEGLSAEQANHMVENALGVLGIPLALCVNLRVNERDWLVPMAIEEASVVAAASHAAKLLRQGGGIQTVVSEAKMIGQIQLLDVPDPHKAEAAIIDARAKLLESADTCDPCLVSHGGGAVDLEVRHLPPIDENDPLDPMLVVHLVVDVREAMGANTVNSMCEHLAPSLQELTGGRARLRIISNLADQCTVEATGRVPITALEGKGCSTAQDLAQGIVEASVFAERDPYRAATHNKGIMNGVDGVLVAFGQDWRAVEAGAHAFAARDGHYSALARWRIVSDDLEGTLKLPMPVGVVGGVTAVHPTYKVARRLATIKTASELASLTAAVGLAQNLGALRALAAEGIQKGHMRVHARNVAVAAGAVEHEVDQVASKIASQGTVNLDAARKILRKSRVDRLGTTTKAIKTRFKELRARHLPRIMELIDEVICAATPENSTLVRMCAYHLKTGGKRLRALLPLLVAEAIGVDPNKLIPFGAACEMLHNATLVHDDLQDGDSVRRDIETVWRRFGMPQAINLGDAMFYYALVLVQRLGVSWVRRENAARRVLRETLRVIDGQEKEFKLRHLERPTISDYYHMVEGKTCGLFALPMAGAAALCGAPAKVVDGLQETARHMGVLFQIQDDILDLFGNKGRDARGSDIREGKRSILAVHALQNAPQKDTLWLKQILDKERDLTTPEEIDRVVRLSEDVGSLTFALDELERRRSKALETIRQSEHQQLQAVIEAMCEIFLDPISPLLTNNTILELKQAQT